MGEHINPTLMMKTCVRESERECMCVRGGGGKVHSVYLNDHMWNKDAAWKNSAFLGSIDLRVELTQILLRFFHCQTSDQLQASMVVVKHLNRHVSS